MKGIKFGNGITIFILFFGVAVLEAFQSGNLLKGVCWLAIGVAFLISDNARRHEQT